MKTSTRWLLGLGAVVLLAFASLIAWMTLREARMAKESETWPVTGGKVVTSALGSSRVKSGSTYRKVIQPDVDYTYEMNGSAHRGWRVSFEYIEGEGRSQKVIEKYPVGSAVTVHYDPTDPSQSVLESGGAVKTPKSPWVGVALFAFLGIFGCAMPLILSFKKTPPSPVS
jgi:hypothetical protein